MTLTSINPCNGQIIQHYDEHTDAQVKQIIDDVNQAQQQWRCVSLSERGKFLLRLASVCRQHADECAELAAMEMGKPVAFGRKECEKAATSCEYYAHQGPEHLAPRHIDTDYHKSYVSYQALGIVFAIMPWNYPIWQVLRFAIPAIMAGNGVILKHAPNVTGCALRIEALFREAGFPQHLLRAVLIAPERAETIIHHPAVAAVTLTGSPRAGRAVAEIAAKALKKCVFELGGSDPYVILADANINLAADAIIFSRMNNSGQVCVAAKRVIVVAERYDDMIAALQTHLSTYTLDDPLDKDARFGPLARADLRDNIHRQVSETIAQGAKCLLGGQLPQGDGFYYPPTLLTDVTADMVSFREELFGPVVSVSRAIDEQHALELANDTQYGLGAAIFTEDLAKGERIARDTIEAGSCYVNTFVASDPRMPFGGIKQSGYGRELSAEGLREFTNIKTVVVKATT